MEDTVYASATRKKDDDATDTICASATSPVNSPLAIIRISGPNTLGAVSSYFSRPEAIKPRTAVFGSINDENKPVDDVILTFYKSPSSYTGEDMAEITCHGNPIIIRKILNILINKGLRMAEPGEFSKRAFLNGKMDLTGAEAINNIITAGSEWGVASAIGQMHGSLRGIVSDIKERIIDLKADVEAGIDFIEEDIEFVSCDDSFKQLNEIKLLITDLYNRCRLGQKMSHGIDIPITGRPNVGKSSILNLILNRERAIVSDIPGTTRDLINETVQFAGFPVNLTDTAGIAETESPLEKIGVKLTHDKIESSPVIIFVIDANAGVTEKDVEIYRNIRNKKNVVLANKIDLVKDKKIRGLESFENVLLFSAKTGCGLGDLEKAINEIIGTEGIDYKNSFLTDIRIIKILEKALENIIQCNAVISAKESPEIIAFELQSLIDTLSEITGEISPEDVLDSVFSRFCIGK